MSNASRLPPPEIQRAAGQVQGWLDQQNPILRSPEEIARMTPAQRLDYARLWDQNSMPAWRDPRDPRGR
jgi:hypothetical protein